MTDLQPLLQESQAAWEAILEAAAKPARYPHFPELTLNGIWKDWSPSPDLPTEEPTSVKQPLQTRLLKTPAVDTSHKFDKLLATWKRSIHSRLGGSRSLSSLFFVH